MNISGSRALLCQTVAKCSLICGEMKNFSVLILGVLEYSYEMKMIGDL